MTDIDISSSDSFIENLCALCGVDVIRERRYARHYTDSAHIVAEYDTMRGKEALVTLEALVDFDTLDAMEALESGESCILPKDARYLVAASTLRSYIHLVNRIPLDFDGWIVIPACAEDIKLTGRVVKDVVRLKGEASIASCVHIAPVKRRGLSLDTVIEGKKNDVFVEVKKSESLSYRKANRCFCAEEYRLVKRAFEDNTDIQCILYTQKSLLVKDGVIAAAAARGLQCCLISEGLIGAVTQTRPVPNEIALCNMMNYDLKCVSFSGESTILIADNIENPDNLGLIIRTADACGADAVISISRYADIYNKNCIRASRGAMGRYPVFEFDYEDGQAIIDMLKNMGYKIYGSSAHTQTTPSSLSRAPKSAFVVSNETYGISEYMASSADEMIRIPMATGQSSLNVAVAAGIILSSAF